MDWFADVKGTVRVMSLDRPVLLVGRQAMNRSVDGDVVVVEIFPKEQWQAPGEEVVDQDSALIIVTQLWHCNDR
jgi:exosome complex exonuclease DIS3/RRP44